MKIGRYKYEFDFFSWIKKTELVELDGVNPSDDPVRPELDNDFRTAKGRKIFGLKYKDDIEGVVPAVRLLEEVEKGEIENTTSLLWVGGRQQLKINVLSLSDLRDRQQESSLKVHTFDAWCMIMHQRRRNQDLVHKCGRWMFQNYSRKILMIWEQKAGESRRLSSVLQRVKTRIIRNILFNVLAMAIDRDCDFGNWT